MHIRASSRADRLFFPLMALIAIMVIGAGFAPTYYLKAWFHAPVLSPMVHVHAAAFSAWLLLQMTQIILVRRRLFRWHQSLGKVGAAIVLLMVVTGYAVIFGKPRPTAAARAFIFTPIVSLLLFPLFVSAAICFRRDPATHKRLMWVATIFIATAGITRLMTMIGLHPTYFRSYAATYAVLLLPLIAFDLYRGGRLHPATTWGIAALLVRNVLHVAIAHTDQWQHIAARLTPPA